MLGLQFAEFILRCIQWPTGFVMVMVITPPIIMPEVLDYPSPWQSDLLPFVFIASMVVYFGCKKLADMCSEKRWEIERRCGFCR